MGKDKLKRFRENETFDCLYQPTLEEVFRRDYRLKGRWSRNHFGNDNPLILELGCGRGEYTVAMARKYPQKNFIGVDIKGARLWRGAKTATQDSIRNAAFLRTRIDFIEGIFGENEVSEIWLTFPDPQIRRANKRLTSPLFIERYRSFLKKGGVIHLKTDSSFLHNYTLQMIKQNNLKLLEANDDIYGTGRADELTSIKTHYESIFLEQGIKITYLSFCPEGDPLLKEPLT